MKTITSVAELETIYGEPIPAAITKVCAALTPNYRKWIDASRFLILSTVGPEGTDASPRGDDGPVVQIMDDTTLLLPDWRGNNRIDSLRNIVRDERVSLMFMVPGSNNVVRVNGTAAISDDQSVIGKFEKNRKLPRTVIVVSIREVYFQCAKALMRSKLWVSEDESAGIPTAGEFVREQKADFDAKAYDSGYAEYAKERMW